MPSALAHSPAEEAALVARTDLLDVMREAVRQLRVRSREVAAVRGRSWEVAAVEGSDELVARDAAEVRESREERLRALAARGGLAAIVAERIDAYHRALQEAPPAGRELHPEFWPSDRGKDGRRATRPS